MEIYGRDFEVEYKGDSSPLTEADKAAHKIIVEGLQNLNHNIPILSEEGKLLDYEIRKDWESFWLVDPLDGTKEFVKKNGEFTVNIALIEGQTPVFGVVYAPYLDWMYYTDESSSYKSENGSSPQKLPIPNHETNHALKIVGSRSHQSQDFLDYLKGFEAKNQKIELISMGSSLKLCLVAEGKADIYPRLGPTMEWDTAAAHAIVLKAGKKVLEHNSQSSLLYNKKNLLNPWFIVQ